MQHPFKQYDHDLYTHHKGQYSKSRLHTLTSQRTSPFDQKARQPEFKSAYLNGRENEKSVDKLLSQASRDLYIRNGSTGQLQYNDKTSKNKRD